MTQGMTSAISAKLNKIYKLKQELKALEDSLKPMVDDLKAIALNTPRDGAGNWVIENDTVRACVSTTIKVSDTAVDFLQGLGRDDLISVKPYVTRDALAQVMGEEEMTTQGLASYTYVMKVTEKKPVK